MNWVDHQGGHRCTRHDETFRRGEVCHRCIADPGDSILESQSDQVDPELQALRNEFRLRAKTMWRAAAELIGEPGDEGTDRDVNAAAKASAEASKWERLALEVYDRFAQKRDLASLIKEYRALLAQDGATH